MIYSDKGRYNILFQKVVHKRGESAIKYIRIFQSKNALEISLGNSYSEDQLMQKFLDNFQHGGKYYAQITTHKE